MSAGRVTVFALLGSLCLAFVGWLNWIYLLGLSNQVCVNLEVERPPVHQTFQTIFGIGTNTSLLATSEVLIVAAGFAFLWVTTIPACLCPLLTDRKWVWHGLWLPCVLFTLLSFLWSHSESPCTEYFALGLMIVYGLLVALIIGYTLIFSLLAWLGLVVFARNRQTD